MAPLGSAQSPAPFGCPRQCGKVDVTRILVPGSADVWGVVVVRSKLCNTRPTDPTLRPRPIPTRVGPTDQPSGRAQHYAREPTS
eukprot:3414677-Prymnesium_polylepis.1